MSNSDVHILRDLAREYAEIAATDVQDERRDLWRRHNSLERTRPLILVKPAGRAWQETPEVRRRCVDDFYAGHESALRRAIYRDFIGDDWILEPWYQMQASYTVSREDLWGPKFEHIPSDDPQGAYKILPALKSMDDISKMAEVHHEIDEETTARNVSRMEEAIGDILPICLSRAPLYLGWRGDISTDVTLLRGLDQVMLDMVLNPEWLHRLVGIMSEGIQRAHAEAEAAGDWRLCNHRNQAAPYCMELEPPSASAEPVTRDRLWGYMAAQEMTLISPAHHEEFILNYQAPIMDKFGLVAYGCCEDLTNKIDMLRKVPNLRRIAVTPVADVAKCAEQIGQDYVLSWRPNPSQMICCGFYPDQIRGIVRHAMDVSRGCHVDISLKDIETVQNKPENLREWVRIVREITDEYV